MLPGNFELPDLESIAGLLPAFEFEGLIAQGGMGAVYKARQRSLDRDVAIKILPRELGCDPLFRNSFQAEARAMARLSHPNLIRVYDSGELDGMLYIVMEYVPGKSLFHSAHRKAIDPKQAVEIVLAACLGLDHAHQNGIIHRDIKPGNILLTPNCEPKIGDFGLARCIRTDADGLAMGTPQYMAPELLNHPERGDRKSDVFALGTVFQELLTGVPAGTDEVSKILISDPLLAAICRKATHALPELRYPDAASFAAQLNHWLALKSATAVMPATAPRPRPASLPIRRKASNNFVLRNCAIISFFLVAIGLISNIYLEKKDMIVGKQQEPITRTSDPIDASKTEVGLPAFSELVAAISDGE